MPDNPLALEHASVRLVVSGSLVVQNEGLNEDLYTNNCKL